MADFYDAEIVKKLDALEKEEDAILKMEAEKADEAESSDEEGISTKDLAAAVKKVKGKINIIKQRSILKAKRRVTSKIRDYNEMTEELEKRGIEVNKESLATRIKNRRTIDDLEYA